ncbi:VanZ like family protein [uncultured archaeon]|nr:VanZ like family protein [uncultured archaeon]
MNFRTAFFGVLTALWAGFIFYKSGQASPLGAPIPEWVAVALHFSEYALLGVLASCFGVGLKGGRRNVYFAVWAACILYGVSDELHQFLVPGRVADFFDVTVDAAGSGFGVLVVSLAAAIIRR